MNPTIRQCVRLMPLCLCLLSLTVFASNARPASTITGSVYDKQRNALPEIEVELLNDYYQSVQRSRTDGTGRYAFNGVSDGRYTIRAYAFRYDLMDQEIPLEIITQSLRGGEGSGSYQQDFYLSPKKGGLADSELGVVFAQDVPKEARTAFDRAMKSFREKRQAEAITSLNTAIQLFPRYYQALHRMGKELSSTKRFGEAVPFLLQAVEVNPKSATTYYYLGYSLHSMGKQYNKAAIVSLNTAYELAPASIQVLYVLGKAERAEGRFTEAEKHLLQAKKMAREGVPEIHKELAQLYADNMNKYEQAADELELYLKTSKLQGDDSANTKKVIAGLRQKARTH